MGPVMGKSKEKENRVRGGGGRNRNNRPLRKVARREKIVRIRG